MATNGARGKLPCTSIVNVVVVACLGKSTSLALNETL